MREIDSTHSRTLRRVLYFRHDTSRRRAITFIVRTIFPMSFIVAVARRHKKTWLQSGFEPRTRDLVTTKPLLCQWTIEACWWKNVFSNQVLVHFLVQKIYIFPESGSRKHFHTSGMRAIDFSHKITLKYVFFFNFWKFFCQNSLYRGKIMRKIDCAHSQNVKMLPWPWFRENIDFLGKIELSGVPIRFYFARIDFKST